MKKKVIDILCIIFFVGIIILDIINIVNNSFTYIILLVFELLTLFLLIFKKNKKYYKDIINIIKNVVLLVTLILGLININSYMPEVIFKSLFTIIIVLQVIYMLKIYKNK